MFKIKQTEKDYEKTSRVERAKTQKIYLINRNINDNSVTFDVMGTRNIVYQVTLSGITTCTCPDYTTRHNRCKHILFILIRIFEIKDPYQEQYTEKEIKDLIDKYKINISKLSIKYDVDAGCIDVGAKCTDDVCAICLDDLDNGEKYVYCKQFCGRCIHVDCYNVVIKPKPKPRCVYCMNAFVC